MQQEIKNKLFEGKRFSDIEKTFYTYYVLENVHSIYGKDEFLADEVDVKVEKNGISIKTVFGINLDIRLVNTQTGITIVGRVNGDSNFIISSFNGVLKNEIVTNSEEKEKAEYKFDANEGIFTYGESKSSLDPEAGYKFRATLTPTGTITNNKELFEVAISRPSVSLEADSLTEKLKENYDAFVYIPYSEYPEATFEGIRIAYTKLRDTASYYTQTNKIAKQKTV